MASAFLVTPANAHFSRQSIVTAASVIMVVAAALFVADTPQLVIFITLVPLAAAFAIGFATQLSLFSDSVDSGKQGWVMGVATALWTLGAGLTSLIVGDLMGQNVAVPFYVAGASAALALILMALLWRHPDLRRIARVVSGRSK